MTTDSASFSSSAYACACTCHRRRNVLKFSQTEEAARLSLCILHVRRRAHSSGAFFFVFAQHRISSRVSCLRSKSSCLHLIESTCFNVIVKIIMSLHNSSSYSAVRHQSQDSPFGEARSTRLNQLLTSPARASYLDRKAIIFATPQSSPSSSRCAQRQSQITRDAKESPSARACDTRQDPVAISEKLTEEEKVHPSTTKHLPSQADEQVHSTRDLVTNSERGMPNSQGEVSQRVSLARPNQPLGVCRPHD